MQSTLVHTRVSPVAFTLDVSPSMAQACFKGDTPAIDDMNKSLEQLYDELEGIRRCRIELGHITFANDVRMERDFHHVDGATPPQFIARGSGTDLGGGVGRALQELDARCMAIASKGLEPLKPWLILITDGMPNGNSHPGFDTDLIERVEKDELNLLPVAVGGYAAFPELDRLSPKQEPIVVKSGEAGSMSFEECFNWISESIKSGNLEAIGGELE